MAQRRFIIECIASETGSLGSRRGGSVFTRRQQHPISALIAGRLAGFAATGRLVPADCVQCGYGPRQPHHGRAQHDDSEGGPSRPCTIEAHWS